MKMQSSSLYLSTLLICIIFTTCREPAPIPPENDWYTERLMAELAERPRDRALTFERIVDLKEPSE